MRNVLFLVTAVALSTSSSAVAQCSSCAGSAPSFQSVPYVSAPVYSGGYQIPSSYGMPISYSSAPVYGQPIYGQSVVYSAPVSSGMDYQSNCCGQSYQAPIIYSSAPMYYSGGSVPTNCGSCAGETIYGGEGSLLLPRASDGIIASPQAVIPQGTVIMNEVRPTPAANVAQPAAPAESVTPPAPEEKKETEGTPGPEEKKDGET